MDLDLIITKVSDFVILYGARLLGAVVVLLIGLWVIKFIMNSISKALDKKNVEPSLKHFLKSLIDIGLKALLVITVLSMIGIQMASFIAVIAAAGLAIGMALSGMLQNFAGGVVILLFKPFKVGDWIEAQGYMGSVSQIQIFNTILKTGDNKTIIIPNGGLSTGSLINYSTEPLRRVDFTFGIGYGDSIEKAQGILMNLVNEDERILNEPAEPFFAVTALADNSVNLALRVWVAAADYWPVFFSMNHKVYDAFNANGINIPFPQMDVHIHNSEK